MIVIHVILFSIDAAIDRLDEAVRILGRLATTHGLSGPNIFLLSRILGAMQDPGAWSGVYVLAGK